MKTVRFRKPLFTCRDPGRDQPDPRCASAALSDFRAAGLAATSPWIGRPVFFAFVSVLRTDHVVYTWKGMAYRNVLNDPGQQRLNATRRVVSHLQELLGSDRQFDLPGIVVIGGQSVGKSSLLEAISGIKLPSDASTCTKCPLQLEMYHSEQTSFSISYEGRPAKAISTLSEVTSEIVQATTALTGGELKMVDSMITVKICSPDAYDLTVIDLPGFLGTAPKGYPENTPAVVQKMVRSYTKGEWRKVFVGRNCL